MASDSPPQQLLLLTGLSGAGKTTALRELEDMGWEAIDNFPIRLLARLLENSGSDGGANPLAIGFDSRTRGFAPNDIIARIKKLSARPDLAVTTAFIDCDDTELERRYNENRRRHPLAGDVPVGEAVALERERLAPLKRWADVVITTTKLSTRQLQETVRERFGDAVGDRLAVTVTSFGFARGMPPVADLVFDMRYLDNPHWHDDLRPLTGCDAPVARHIANDADFRATFPRIRDLVLDLLPKYLAQGKRYVTVAFGCTGGRHRSVYSAEQMAQALRDSGFEPTLIHRNLAARGADLVEGETLA